MTVSSVDQNAASVSIVETSALPELASAPSMAGGTEVKNALPMFAAAKTDVLPDLGSAPSLAGGTPHLATSLIMFAAAKSN